MTDDKPKWRLYTRLCDHCPGGCYVFGTGVGPKFHIPVDMFWGRTPWRRATK